MGVSSCYVKCKDLSFQKCFSFFIYIEQTTGMKVFFFFFEEKSTFKTISLQINFFLHTTIDIR